MPEFSIPWRHVCAVVVLLGVASNVQAGTEPYFIPLTASAPVETRANSEAELTAPWVAPEGVTSRSLTNLHEIDSDPSQSVIRVPEIASSLEASTASMFDMSAFDATGRYIFTPHEVRYGAGLSRYDIAQDRNEVLFVGDGGGKYEDWRFDYGALDPATLTPKGTILVAEEWSGQGRMFEVGNILGQAGAQTVTELAAVPNVSIEGLRFSKDGRAIYFGDENKSGSIYKFVPSVRGDYTKGQSFVLIVDGYSGDPATKVPPFPRNQPQQRTGAAHWQPLTDKEGRPLTVSDPFDNETRGGRAAADEMGGTPYRRPEDLEVGVLGNRHEVLYFTATGENAIYSVEMLDDLTATVRLMADENTIKNAGFAPTSARLNAPDNLAQDAMGNIYVVEDAPNISAVGGDVWFLRDTDSDGVAESVDHFLSNRVPGSESTGMIFNPAKPNTFIINVQHPRSTARRGGYGDAIWQFDISETQAPR